ncbi:hypothetical protein BC939DRAFT_444725, partial [Gamsiella multidivaricata]|uniref:uncharacterized protein n=1 Tax=Gamsiella multidivaricata TaxID=101098 RepID=UPI00221FA49D
MITVPSQEIAVFLGNHLDQVLQQTAVDFVQSVAANRQFRAGCTLMDILNGVESVNERIRVVLQEQSRGKPSRGGHASEMVMVRITSLYLLYSLYSGLPIQQNPFLCLFMDTYITSLQHDQQRPERFVISVILNGDGEELAPSTPSELVAIAQEVESKPVDLRYLEHLLPDVPIDDQLVSGLGWESVGQQRRGDKKSAWDSLVDTLTGPESLYAMGNDSLDSRATSNTSGDSGLSSGRAEESSTITADNKEAHIGNDGAEEEELEEWEIEAEKHFQDLEDVAPAPAKVNNKPKKPTGTTVNRQQLNAIMEQATTQPLTF